MKLAVLSLVFLSACSLELSSKNINPLSFFKKPSCDKAYKKILENKELSNKEINRLEKKALLCLKEDKVFQAIFIFERLLRELKNLPAEELKALAIEKKIAELSFKTKNYEKALKYYSRLLEKNLNAEEWFVVQFHIAESFFYLKKHSQALREVEKCFLKEPSIEQRKQVIVLKGRILIAQKKFEPAILLFEKQIERFPNEEPFFREYLALIYESKKDFVSAVNELKKIKPASLFINQKIQRLLQRQNNQPGFK